MNNFKIIISPSKTFNKNAALALNGKRPIFIDTAKKIFKEIKKLSLEETKIVYKLSDKKASEVFSMNKAHGTKLYYAIELYGGLFYKQLSISEKQKQWINDHVVIIDALYGIVKPYDLISPYRLDFKTRLKIDLRKIWKNKINSYFDKYEVINLASKEFSSLIGKNMQEIILPKGQIKVERGKKFMKIISDNKVLTI